LRKYEIKGVEVTRNISYGTQKIILTGKNKKELKQEGIKSSTGQREYFFDNG